MVSAGDSNHGLRQGNECQSVLSVTTGACMCVCVCVGASVDGCLFVAMVAVEGCVQRVQ